MELINLFNTSRISYLLKSILLCMIVSCLFMSCDQDVVNTNTTENATVQINFKSSVQVDSIIFFSGMGFEKEDVYKYEKTLKIQKDSINNQFTIGFLSNDNFYAQQLWLKGTDVVINASIEEGKIEIDTVLNSPFTYKTKASLDEYYRLLDTGVADSLVNNYLLNAIKLNANNAFSNQLSREYLYSNMEDKSSLRKLYDIIDKQEPSIKSHFLSQHDKLEKILDLNILDAAKYELYDKDLNLTRIDFSENKVNILDFWFTDCKPCLLDHERMLELVESSVFEDANIIGVSIDHDAEKWKNHLISKNYPWSNFLQNKQMQEGLSDALSIFVFPTYVIVSDSGEVLAMKNSITDVKYFLEHL